MESSSKLDGPHLHMDSKGV